MEHEKKIQQDADARPDDVQLVVEQAAGSGPNSAPRGFAPGELVLGRYKILELLGQGGIGSVYRVEQMLLKKQFALKTLNFEGRSQTVLLRFQNEARAASRLDHPNIVRAHDFGVTDDNRPFLVMELVEGQSLSQYLKQHHRISPEMAIKIFVPICLGLDHAHANGVVHRDIKPGNIILTQPNELFADVVPKIVDFGIAKQEGDGQSLTKTGEVFGTPLYMSPEQCSGVPIDSRSDIYSLGCVLFEALSGVPPFQCDSALQTMMQHRVATPLSLKETALGGDFPPRLEAIVARALEKDPAKRYQTCKQLADDLKHLENPAFANSVPATSRSTAATRPALDARMPRWIVILCVVSLVVSMLGIALAVYFGSIASDPDARRSKHISTMQDATSVLPTAESVPLEEAIHDNAWLATTLHRSAPTFLTLKEHYHINDQALAWFERCPGARRIEALDLTDCTNITDDGLASLSALLSLHKLNLTATNITDAGLLQLVRLKSLEALDLRDTKITDTGVALLRKLKLQSLSLSSTKTTGSAFSDPGNLAELRALQLDGTELHDFSGFPKLHVQDLDLSNTRLTPDSLDQIAQMPNLTFLRITSNPGITGAGLLKLARCPHLGALKYSGNDFRPQDVAKLHRLRPGIMLVKE